MPTPVAIAQLKYTLFLEQLLFIRYLIRVFSYARQKKIM